jgi:hypothetical protein
MENRREKCPTLGPTLRGQIKERYINLFIGYSSFVHQRTSPEGHAHAE